MIPGCLSARAPTAQAGLRKVEFYAIAVGNWITAWYQYSQLFKRDLQRL